MFVNSKKKNFIKNTFFNYKRIKLNNSFSTKKSSVQPSDYNLVKFDDFNLLNTVDDDDVFLKIKNYRKNKEEADNLIKKLNQMTMDSALKRLETLKNDLKKINKKKLKNLDELLNEFMLSNLVLPNNEIKNRPWAEFNEDVKKIQNTNFQNDYLTGVKKKFSNLKFTKENQNYSKQELYIRYLNHFQMNGKSGSNLINIYNPEELINNSYSLKDTTMKSLVAAGCHLGHSTALWRSSTQPYIYGIYRGIHIINLNETLINLKRCCNVIKYISKKGGVILYVDTRKNTQILKGLVSASERSSGYYVFKKWLPGTITNFFKVVKLGESNCLMEVDMQNQKTKRHLNCNEILKPDLVVILNPVENRNCIKECIKFKIPTIGLCDTNMEPSLLTYPIPCNDDSIRSVLTILGILSKAAEDGINERLYQIKKNKNHKSNELISD